MEGEVVVRCPLFLLINRIDNSPQVTKASHNTKPIENPCIGLFFSDYRYFVLIIRESD